MRTLKAESPFRWPFPPAPKAGRSAAGAKARSRQTAAAGKGRSAPGSLTPARMATDIAMVIVWGARIPGVMWLAAAGGF